MAEQTATARVGAKGLAPGGCVLDALTGIGIQPLLGTGSVSQGEKLNAT